MLIRHLLKGMLSLAVVALLTSVVGAQDFKIQILHNNDGESNLFPGSDGFGGVAQFSGKLNELRFEAWQGGFPTILLSSGDNFLPGQETEASLALPMGEVPYDSRVFNELGYDAFCIGNHDFDLGPDYLARIIGGLDETKFWPQFLSANLDFSGEPALQAFVESQKIAKSTILYRGDERIGVIGLTTPNLDFISAPRNVEVMDNLAEIVAEEVTNLEARGINKIILISHLQGIAEDRALVGSLSGVDVVIAGGGDEILANDPSQVIPGDEIQGEYPQRLADADGENVLVVTTGGDYRYVGNLTVTFDAEGRIIEVDEASGPVPVTGRANPRVEEVIQPVADFIAGLEAAVIGTTEVDLDGVRNSVRGEETNEGNLIADAFLWQSQALAEEFGAPTPMVAIQNGGGIRNNNVIAAGSDITIATTFDILPFNNTLSVVNPISAERFKLVMENAVSRITGDGPSGGGTGRFAQIAGFSIVYDTTGTPAVLEGSGLEITATEPGSRIISITLDDGTPIVANGQVVEGAPDITVATLSFTAGGGDQYPWADAGFTRLPVSDQRSLQNYIEDALSGVITAEQYPAGGEGRITIGEAAETTTVVDVIVNSEVHNTLEAAVIAAELADDLSGAGPFTVFAPTDDAFAALPAGTVETLLEDPTGDLANILLYHVVSGSVLSTDLMDGMTAPTLLGEDVTVTINADGVFINDAQVTMADIQTDNGVVHVIDAVLLPPAGGTDATFELAPIGTYNTGIFDEAAAEIVAYDAGTQRLFFTNSDANTVTVLDITDPTTPTLVTDIDMSVYGGGVNSVAVFEGLVAIAVEAEEVDANGSVVFFDTDGTYINDVEAGVLPDMLIFTNAGDKVITANEGQPNDDYTIDPEGSVSIIDVSAGAADATVTNVTFSQFNAFEDALRSEGLRIFGPGASVAQDAEPEYVAVSADDATAFVVLQENNAVAVIDIASASVTGVLPLGTKDHSIMGNGLDASNRSDSIDITTHPVKGLYLPDAMVSVEIDGETYLITANEGDSRDYDGFSEEARIADVMLDPTAFPNAADLQDDANLGRLKITTTLGDTDGDGDYDELFTYGARSFTIWDTQGNIVFDSGDDFEQITAELLPTVFNSSNDETGLKNRSDDKGPEPEAVAIAELDGKIFALIGMERIGGIFVYDITDPANATYINYVNNRNFDADPTTPEAGDLGVEGIVFIPAADSPTDFPLVVTANEVSGTVTIFSVNASGMIAPSTEALARSVEVATTDATVSVFPNPATEIINIAYDVAEAGNVQIFVSNANGQRVATVFNGVADQGTFNLTVAPATYNMPTGLYFISVQTAEGVETQAVTVK